MRIAWISFGFEEYSLAHVEMLAREHEVMAAIPKSQSFDQSAVRYAKVDLYAFENPRLRQVLTQSALALKIVRRVRDFEPDVVHYQHGHLWFNFVLRGIRRYPLVLTIHDPRHHLGDFESRKTPQWIMDFGFRRADRIIVHGHSLVSVVCDSIPFPSEKVHVIPHVAIGGGDQLAGTCCDDDEEEPGCVLFFGRIWEYKGLDYLIKAEPYISAEIENLKIVIAGRGEDFGRYRNLMIHPERFEVYNDFVSNEERNRMFRRAAVVVVPYVAASQSGVVEVAFHHSKPVVATRVGALAEYVEHQETGLLVAPRDEVALANAIVTLLKNVGLRKRLGRNGHLRQLNERGPETVVKKTLEVYRSALSDCRPRNRYSV